MDEDDTPLIKSIVFSSLLSKKCMGKDYIPLINNTGTEKEYGSLETSEERRHRKISMYISCWTMFSNSVGFGMLVPSIWPYLNKVCISKLNKKNELYVFNFFFWFCIGFHIWILIWWSTEKNDVTHGAKTVH